MKLKKKFFRDKKAIEMTFNWIFAIVVGGFILFIAVYGAGKLIRTSEQTIYTETAASLVSFFDPLETGLASGKASEISFKKKSRIFFGCNEETNNPFGIQYISFSEQSFGESFGERGGEITIRDKYVFTDSVLQGKKVYYFSKPLFMGFKVSDILVMYSDEQQYCVYDADEAFQDDIEGLKLKQIVFVNKTEHCEGIQICFSQRNKNCDIQINEDQEYVLKNGKKLYYKDELLHAALFSSPEMYECNVKRIKQRFNELGKVYLEKINIIERVGCEPQIGPKLSLAISHNITNSRDLAGFFTIIEDIEEINQRAKDGCRLYYNTNFGR
jgi:hypothetical protein